MENKVRIRLVLLFLIVVFSILLISLWKSPKENDDIDVTEGQTEEVEEIATEIETEVEDIEEEVAVEQAPPVVIESEKEEVPIPPQELESEVIDTESEEPEIETEETEIEDVAAHYIPIPEEWNLIVVNRWNKIPENYTVELTELSNGQKVDSRISESLQQMFDAAVAVGINLKVREGYRSTEQQQSLFDEKVKSYIEQGYSEPKAQKLAKEWVAVPGTGEHEIGLAVDINADQTGGYNMKAYAWLAENAHKFGFILRYPSGKEAITGIKHEPWHFRYVGLEAAEEIYISGICLEEYLLSR